VSSRTPVTPVSPPVRFPPGDSEATSLYDRLQLLRRRVRLPRLRLGPRLRARGAVRAGPAHVAVLEPERCPSTAQSRLRLSSPT